MAQSRPDQPDGNPACYRIKLRGIIREDWSDWLSGMEITTTKESGTPQTTTLSGVVPDQAALRGILCKLWDLNLTVLSVSRLEGDQGEKEGKR